MIEARITGLYVYPVKSLGGVALDRARLTPKGLRHDRRFMVVRPNGRFVTQRDLPGLALIGTRLLEEGVELSAAKCGALLLPFAPPAGSSLQTRVWQDDCEAVDVGEEASAWLTAAAGSPETLRLVRMAPGFRRRLAEAPRFGEHTTTVFADSAPFLVANEASLQALNETLNASGSGRVPMNRFRPNIVFDGADAFDEHRARSLAGSDWRLELVDHCVRCVVTTVDQATAQRDPGREPLATLRRLNPAPGPRAAPAFGVNAVLAAGADQCVAVGDVAWLSGHRPG